MHQGVGEGDIDLGAQQEQAELGERVPLAELDEEDLTLGIGESGSFARMLRACFLTR